MGMFAFKKVANSEKFLADSKFFEEPMFVFKKRVNLGLVKRQEISLAEKRGWKSTQNTLTTEWRGRFKGKFNYYEGKAEEFLSSMSIFIKLDQVPHGLQKHRKWGCFGSRGEGWYFVHYHVKRDLSSAIFEIETILNEASC